MARVKAERKPERWVPPSMVLILFNFCRASADEFNYSSNPTFTDSSGNLVVIDDTTDSTQKSFSFITSVGLYDASNNLLAIAKLSRPIEKNDEKDLTIRIRLDF